MFQEAASLAEVDQWLRNLKHKELENKNDERKQLALVLELLRDDLMPNQITVDRVDSDGLWLKDRKRGATRMGRNERRLSRRRCPARRHRAALGRYIRF